MRHKHFGMFIALSALLFGLFVPLQAAETLDAAYVLAQARLATHFAQWQSTKGDLTLEANARFEGVNASYHLAFSSSGQFVETLTGRLSQTTGFDGATAWQTDHSLMPLVLDGQDREKALMVGWVLTGRWASPDCLLVASLLPDQATEARVVLALKFPTSVLVAKLVVDRRNWLPLSLTYTTQTGLQNWQFTDYRPESGLMLPHLWMHQDNDLMDTFTVRSVRPLGHAERAYAPVTARPSDTVWDNEAPPRIAVRRDRVGEILVHPLVDGKDVGWFLLDTGTNVMGIGPKMADAIHLPRFGAKSESGAGTLLHSAFRTGRTFQLGPLTLSRPLFEEFDFRDIGQHADVPVVGVCGYDLFARAVVELDMDGGTVALYNPVGYERKAGTWQSLSLDNRVPSVRAKFEGDRAGVFGLDTGFTGSVVFFPSAVERLGLLPSQAQGARISGFGGGFAAQKGSLGWFEIGGQRFTIPPVWLCQATQGDFSSAAVTGYVGDRLLTSFSLVLDYPNKRIAFVRHQTR